MKFDKSIFFFFFLNFPLILCDLPVHCLKNQIIGKWKIYATELYNVKSGHEMKCGQQEPSTPYTAWKAIVNLTFNQEHEIQLMENDTAKLKLDTYSNATLDGDWTMVYDEGFDINFRNLSFFSFSKYKIERSKIQNEILEYKSMCYSTLIGWYHTLDNKRWGCFRGEKLGVNVSDILFEKAKNVSHEEMSYVDPIYRKSNEYEKTKTKINTNSNNMRFVSSSSSFFKNIPENKINEQIHKKYLDKLSKVKNSWRAKLYPQFMNMSISELNKFAGIERPVKFDILYHSNSIRNLLKSNFNNLVSFRFNSQINSQISTSNNTLNIYPKNFNWKTKLKQTQSQGRCGSCYVFSAMRMLESRIKILFDDDVTLSVQHSLDCSYYNQGCKGGYAYLAMKFSKEFELVPELCHPYLGRIGQCSNSCDLNSLNFPYFVEKYGYLGGSYGRNVRNMEELMMEELYKHGPFVVSIQPEYNFMHYESGIYNSDKLTGLPSVETIQWRKVDHSVLLAGWGEDKFTSEKYWLIQNSWGENWGEDGYFRIRRGTDELHVESMGEIATPGIKKNLFK